MTCNKPLKSILNNYYLNGVLVFSITMHNLDYYNDSVLGEIRTNFLKFLAFLATYVVFL